MDIVKIAAIGIITAVCVLILRETKSETAMLVGIVGGCLILLSVVDYFLDIFSVLQGFMDRSGIPGTIYATVFKIIGIGYIADFSAGIVEDTGQKALAEKILFASKIIIMVLSLPILMLLFDTVTAMLP
ncbi:MAG: stage III sporulation protein AD [Firmicutes bacterium]|nr:stage III sporulation protein AD [Bacillota bacterium]